MCDIIKLHYCRHHEHYTNMQAVVSRVNDLLKSSQTVSYLGSTLLRVLDMFAVNNHNASVENNITQDNVGK